MSGNPLVIIGGGHACAEVSITAWDAGWSGEIMLVSAEKAFAI